MRNGQAYGELGIGKNLRKSVEVIRGRSKPKSGGVFRRVKGDLRIGEGGK